MFNLKISTCDLMKRSSTELGYNIPVKIKLEEGRYKHGYVKSLSPDKRGQVRIFYAGGRISQRDANSVIHEPKGFNHKTTS